MTEPVRTSPSAFIIDETHDPRRETWVEDANGHPDFPIQNLPLGVFSSGAGDRRGGVAIGDHILDLAALSGSGLLPGDALIAARAATGPVLNPLLALGSAPRRALRRRMSELLSDPVYRAQIQPMLYPQQRCTLHRPASIGDYTDFYVGIHHATNVGRLFRPDNPLLPNYKHVPIGYHGRASSVRVSGATVRRPTGQIMTPGAAVPTLEASRRLDYELELGVWIGMGNDLGERIPIERAADHIAGLSLLNDWSARDIQAWEYQPLGPFIAKNFLTTISPWIVTAEALAPYRIAQPARPSDDPAPLPYLTDHEDQARGGLAIMLEVTLQSAAMQAAGHRPVTLSRGPASNMYWTIAQMVTHHTIGGCDLNPGDLLGTGTISAAEPAGYGSLIELARGGTEPLILPTGEKRSFLEDGDTLAIRGRAEAANFVAIGFGTCVGTVEVAK